MVLLVLVPLLPLLTAFIVMTGHRADQDQTAKAGLFPIVAAFVGAARHSGARALRGGYHGQIL